MSPRAIARKAAVVAALTLVLAVLAAGGHCLIAQADHSAVLVVRFGDGSQIERRVCFAEDSITGLELLRRSGLAVSTWGAAVCKIEDEGCDYPSSPCFCQCPGSPCSYWSYWHWREGRWMYSSVGSADNEVGDGDVEGWVWGDGQSAPEPPSLVATCSSEDTGAASGQVDSEAALPPAAATTGARADLSQYAIFVIMLIALIGGYVVLKTRRQE